MSLAYLGAWLLPVWAGAALVAAALRPVRSGAALAVLLGCGHLLGLVLVAALAPWVVGDAVDRTFERIAPWLAVIAAVASALALVLRRRWTGDRGIGPVTAASLPRWLWALVALLVLAMVWRIWGLAGEALLRPTFPWDAWAAWQVKSKAWFLADRALPFVAPADWLLATDPQVRTLPSWRYPDFLTWLQLWYASAAGGWIEPAVNLAWSGALSALALAAYGQSRRLGVPVWLAVALVWALVSLPLVETHVALAGYADLWLMAMFGVAAFAGLHWARTRDRADGLLALAATLCLPLIKLEGAVWAGVLIAVSAWCCVPVRTRWGLAALAVALVVLLAVGGWAVPLPGLGELRLGWGRIELGAVGTLDLYWRPVGEAVVAALFHLPNWHLLWYLLPVLMAWRWRRIGADPAAAWAARVLGVCLSLLFVLFFFTDASSWAVDYTSANRLFMQIVPAAFALAAALAASAAAAQSDEPAAARVFRPR